MLNRLLEHHILANLTFLLVMVIGWMAYFELPREQDPSVNFNWVEITTYWPGAAATDVERRVTEPLEEGLKRIQDVRFVSSVSREGVSTILVRFQDIDTDEFDTRVADLRREILARLDELPDEARQPEIIEITSANAFPTATVVAWAESDDTVLHREGRRIRDDIKRMDGVDRVLASGIREPELRVRFLPERLVGLGVSPVDLADSVSAYFRDLAAGKLIIGDQRWLVRLAGTSNDPSLLEQFPIVTAEGEIPLRAVAEVQEGLEDPQQLVRYQGRPAVLYWVMKQERANNLELLQDVNAYIDERNRFTANNGVALALLDDQTVATRNAIRVMESNALIGLALVVLSVGLFLGWRTALITSVGIPFVLAGTFLVVLLLGQTLNTTVLLAIVISLGMLVDDAVVVVEAIQYHLAQGKKAVQAARLALNEVALPVTTAVLTTIAAFLPLIMMPGVLGDFMRVVPIVVTVALLLSLVEAFWMLPSHMVSFQPRTTHKGVVARWRGRLIRPVKHGYVSVLLAGLRRPWLSLAGGFALLGLAVFAIASGAVRVDFFATDLYRMFYVNVDMPPGSTLEKTLETVARVEQRVRDEVGSEARSVVGYAGQQLTDKEALFGDERGQVFVSLLPATVEGRSVDEIIEAVRGSLDEIAGPMSTSFVRRKTGPPVTKPISIKVRADDIGAIRLAVTEVKGILQGVPGVSQITDDDFEGGSELSVRLDPDAITRTGMHPAEVSRLLRLFATGEQVASMQYQGDRVEVRLLARPDSLRDIDEYLGYPVSLPSGGEIALGELLHTEYRRAESNVRHHDFRRAVTVEADIDPAVTDTLRANRAVQQAWAGIATMHPGVSLDFSGELDDIQESLGSMAILFLFGIGLVYLILGTQFRSYTQPLIVLAAVPMAFVGVVFGLGISGNPLSLFTLYGVVALAGIAANDAIVLVATANRLRQHGSSPAGAVAHAAKRRFLPIVITSTTTIAGLYSLAVGLGGHSLMWAPVATAIVWGLVFSTVLTLLLVPVIYVLAVRSDRAGLSEPGLLPMPVSIDTSIRSWLTQLFSARARRAQRELQQVLRDDESRALYQEGLKALSGDDLETPIRCFERLVADEPDSLELNVLAAQANIRLMQVRGWDIGYAARARRYLTRAKSVAPSDARVQHLLALLEDIESGVEAP
jgi:multidrug efflux pump subunit AcrB